MEPAASDVRRRARYHVLRGPPAELVHDLAPIRRFMVLLFQVATLILLAWRGFPGSRLLVYAAICVFYLAFCRHPEPPVAETTKVRILMCALLSYGGWLANTGGLSSPLIPLGLGILLPALLIFETRRQRVLFATSALGTLLAIGLLSWWPVGSLVPPLAPRDGHASPEYLIIMTGSILVTASMVSGFWTHVSAAYARVAVELGNRREQVCSMGEDRTRELEGAAAHLSHEMKNPLASIKCLSAHLARGSALDGKTVERLQVVLAEADRLESIVNGFISVSRGLGELNPAPVRPHEIALELKLLLEVRAAEAGVTIEVTGPPDLELVADGRQIHRALFYLVMNAVQASPRGRTVTIDVGPGTAPGGARIQIIDRGEGMSPAVLERLKRPPFSTREGGTGLGVAVARAVIEQHGGRLEYDSAPGHGTVATVELPQRPPAREGVPRLVPEALRHPSPEG